jgi:hypothetical protein
MFVLATKSINFSQLVLAFRVATQSTNVQCSGMPIALGNAESKRRVAVAIDLRAGE